MFRLIGGVTSAFYPRSTDNTYPQTKMWTKKETRSITWAKTTQGWLMSACSTGSTFWSDFFSNISIFKLCSHEQLIWSRTRFSANLDTNLLSVLVSSPEEVFTASGLIPIRWRILRDRSMRKTLHILRPLELWWMFTTEKITDSDLFSSPPPPA